MNTEQSTVIGTGAGNTGLQGSIAIGLYTGQTGLKLHEIAIGTSASGGDGGCVTIGNEQENMVLLLLMS